MNENEVLAKVNKLEEDIKEVGTKVNDNEKTVMKLTFVHEETVKKQEEISQRQMDLQEKLTSLIEKVSDRVDDNKEEIYQVKYDMVKENSNQDVNGAKGKYENAKWIMAVILIPVIFKLLDIAVKYFQN